MTSTFAHELPPLQRLLDLLYHLALPATTYGLWFCGGVIRFVRNGLLDTLSEDYVRTAKAQRLSDARVLWMHALPNAVGPLIQRFGASIPNLIGGSVIIEVIFSWPGIGQTVYQAFLQQDYPVILAGTALAGGLVVSGTMLADLLHAWFDPRVRHG
jgi:peptide/nickel transport system permease protein